MTSIRRHQLAYLSVAGWADVSSYTGTQAAQQCLQHWALRGLPVVVTRQPGDLFAQGSLLSVGIAAPMRWGLERLQLKVRKTDIAYFDDFPLANAACKLMSSEHRDASRRLFQELSIAGLRCRVFGSHGWQLLTGLKYLRPGSDLDLLLNVSSPDEADRAADCLMRHEQQANLPRIDGELAFGNGSAVSWREWLAWRSGAASAILVKSTSRLELATSLAFTQQDSRYCISELMAA